MKRTKLIGNVFHSIYPEGTAGPWSVGYSGHTDRTGYFSYPEFDISSIRNITDRYVPGTSNPVMNDVYIDYTYLSGTTLSGVSSIYTYYYPGTITITAGNGFFGTFSGLTGDTYQAQAKMDTGGYDVTTDCTWVSSNPSVATIGEHTGLITFLSPGYTLIDAYYLSGTWMSRGAYCYWPGSIAVTPLSYSGITGTTIQLSATTVTGAHDVTSVSTWTSDDETKATVYAGLVTLVGSGVATITAVYSPIASATSSITIT